MGKAKGKGSACLNGKEEGRNYRGWEKETLAAYESPLGGTQKSNPTEINSAQRGFIVWLGLVFANSRGQKFVALQNRVNIRLHLLFGSQLCLNGCHRLQNELEVKLAAAQASKVKALTASTLLFFVI